MRRVLGLLAFVPLMAGCSTPAQPAVGDCLASLDVGRPRVVDCQRPHAAQVVGIYTAPGDKYPGADQLQAAARSVCDSAFEEFVGIPALRSVYDLVPLLPTEESWQESEDREVLCVARPTTNEELTASIEGSER